MTFSLLKYLKAVATEKDQTKPLRALENCITEMVLDWCRNNREKLVAREPLIDHAFNVYYFDHMKFNPKDVEIVEKTEKRVLCRWRNPCQVLEECKLLKLDTKIVCREAFEKPAKTLLKQIDPKLNFRRNYKKIRPYTDFCEEIIEIL